MAYRNQQAEEMVARWQDWLKTRNRYVPMQKDSVLSSMMAEPRKRPVFDPDWDNDQEAAYFHLALMSLPEGKRLAFLKVYGSFAELRKPVKYWCYVLGEIGRNTFYDWAHEAASQAVIRAKRMQSECPVLSNKLGQTKHAI